jgi:isopropylmalate/homocitrate/citramalate synthase
LSIKYLDQEKRREFLAYLRKESIDLPDYEVVEVPKPKLYKEFFPWDKPPLTVFDGILLPLKTPEKIWITDTTFRDGQQAREPYSVKQIVDLYTMLHELGGPQGKILQSEFFLYSKRDREAVEACRNLGYKYPEIVGWMRPTYEDFMLVKESKVEECGMVTPVSDYHIFYKFPGLGRQKVISKYLEVVEEVFKLGIVPRVHLEDSTRADVFGVVVPFIKKLTKLSRKYGVPFKVRVCDTLGVGLPWDGAALPRSVPKLIWVLNNICDVPSEQLEFHGHNDFHMGVANSVSAWLYGASLVNCTLLGIGERAGNVPLEAMVFMYATIKGDLDGMDTRVITKIARYYEEEVGYSIPPYYPIVGENFNITWAGIHADGLLKNIEMYLPFDTEKLLDRPPGVAVSDYSGLAGVVFWINHYFRLTGENKVTKSTPGVVEIHNEIKAMYEGGRLTRIGNEEMLALVKKHMPWLLEKVNNRVKVKLK